MSTTFVAWDNPLSVLLKQFTRAKQRRWAEALAERIRAIAPPEIDCRAAGWYPGCEPFFQWRRLEWVGLQVRVGEGTYIGRVIEPYEQPTDGEIGAMCCDLLRQAAEF